MPMKRKAMLVERKTRVFFTRLNLIWPKNPGGKGLSLFWAFEINFFKVSVLNFHHCFTRYNCPFYNSQSRIMMCNLHCCYTFALLLDLYFTALSQSELRIFHVGKLLNAKQFE